MQEVIEENPFLKAQKKLDSEHKRTKYVQDNMKYISPREIVLNPEQVRLGKRKDVIHYVPITETMKILLEDETFNLIHCPNTDQEENAVLSEMKQGSIFKTNPYFKENPSACGIILYSDAVEIKGTVALRPLLTFINIFYLIGIICIVMSIAKYLTLYLHKVYLKIWYK